MSENNINQTEEDMPLSDSAENITPPEKDESELHNILYGGEYSEYREDLDLSELEKEQKNDDRLSTFAQTSEEKSDKPVRTDSKKRKMLICVLFGVFVLLIALYLILGPVGFDVFGFKETQETPIVYTTGEVPAAGNVWLMFEHVERNNIQSIEVHNDHGTFTVYYSPADNAFYFLGAETLSYDQELFSYLVVHAGYTLFSQRLEPHQRSENLSEYGLAPEDDPAYYILTTRSGNTHKVYIGNSTLDEDQYYVMYEGRDIVYVLENSIKNSLLADVKDLLTPVLTFPVSSSSDYYTKIPEIYITLDRKEPYMLIEYTKDSKETQNTFGVTIPYMIRYPKDMPASTEQVTSLFQYIINMTADELVEYGICYTYEDFDPETGKLLEQTDVKPEVLLKHGITQADKAIIYTYEGYPSIVYFSDKRVDENKNEFYYAWSPIMNILTKISASSVPFLQWNAVDFIDKAIFNAHIDKVGTIEFTDKTSEQKHFVFKLSGKGDDLSVHETVSDTYLKPNKSSSDTSVDDIHNFRQLYKSALYISAGDYIETPQQMSLIAQIKVTMRDGYEMNYEFFAYSDQRCYYTINGEGEFYVKRSQVQKLFADAQRVIDGIEIDPESEY